MKDIFNLGTVNNIQGTLKGGVKSYIWNRYPLDRNYASFKWKYYYRYIFNFRTIKFRGDY